MSTHVYRLDIIYPEGSGAPGWAPANWPHPAAPRKLRRQMTRRGFTWPRERMFLSSSGAYYRAWLLESYGAEVTVRRSLPVEWPDPRQPNRWELGGTPQRVYTEPDTVWPEFDASGLPRERVPA